MPPKKNAAKDRLRREEAEQKAREEEERRKLEEEASLEEEERLREAREIREKEREEDRIRFQQVTQVLNQELLLKGEALEQWKSENLKKMQWEHYVSCHTIPDPSDEKAMNTYLTLSEEDPARPLIQEVVSVVHEWLQVCDKIQRMLCADCLPEPSAADANRYKQTMSRLQGLILKRLNQTTLHYMGEADKHVDSETFNLSVQAGLPRRLKFGLWGNVVKDPRLRSFSFKEHFDLTIETPKPLLLADIAVRVTQVDFDLLSPQCSTYHCSRAITRSNLSTALSVLSSVGLEEGELILDQVEAETEAGATVAADASDRVRSELVASRQQLLQEASAIREDGEGMNGQGGGVMELPISSATITLGRGEEDRARAGVSEVAITVSGPKGVSLEEDEIDLRSFQPARGPIYLQALELPPQPKSINNWTVKKVLSDHVPTYTYPVMPRPPPPAEGEEAAPAPALVPGSALWQPIGITTKLPSPYIYSEEPQLARWDEGEKIWRTKGTQDPQFDMEEKTVTFQIFYFCPFALMVDQYANMPYVSWQMLPVGNNHTLLTIEGGVTQISVQIKGENSTLIGPEDQPSFSHLLNQTMSAKHLIAALKSVGANFFPEPDAGRYVSVTKKRFLVEVSAYRSMALASCGYGFQWSHWNGEVAPGNVVLQVAEGSDGDTEKLVWRNYVGGKKSFRLHVMDDSEMFSLDKEDGYKTHPELYSALQQESPPAIVELMKDASPMHYEAVLYWLNSTKVLTFA